MAQVQPQLDDESAFQQWYAQWAQRLGLDPNPDSPEQQYDYRAAFRAGAEPDPVSHHWPSDFKLGGHEHLVVGGFHTQTGERVPNTERAKSVEELVSLGWEPETAMRLMETPEPLLPSRSIAEHGLMYGPKGRR